MQISTEQLFEHARTHSHWLDRPIPESTLRRLWDLARMGPTSANCSPARLVFVTTPAAKDRLVPCMSPGNQDKTRRAPATMIVGMDMAFHEQLPRLFPHADARSWFEGKPALIESTAFRNSSLQGGYLILAARALGLDCGPMSGFDADKVDATFFAGTSVRVNFICNLGHGDAAHLHPRHPRLEFDEACRIE
jgi:3-hydroxypropanoate dehydrogenase